MKNKFNSILTLSLVILLTISVKACDYNLEKVKGNENIVTVEQTVDDFDALRVSGMFRVYLVEGTSPQVVITTDENIQDYVTVEVRNNKLFLGMESGNYSPTKLEAYITTAALSHIAIAGAASITGDHTLTGDNMLIDLSGASNIDLKVNLSQLETKVSGAGKINLSGKADTHRLRISGVASVDCYDLETTDTHVSISGAASAKVHATGHLDARVSGVGSIRYAGNPASTHTETSGAGSINPV